MISGAKYCHDTPAVQGPVQSGQQTFITGSRHPHHQTLFKDRQSQSSPGQARSIIISINNRIISPEKCPSQRLTGGQGEATTSTSKTTAVQADWLESRRLLSESAEKKCCPPSWLCIILHSALPARHHHLYKVIKGISIAVEFFTNFCGCLLRLGGMYNVTVLLYTL